MKKLSLQWRIALLTALFIAISCIALNFLIYHSGAHYFGVLHKYVTEKDGEYPFPESTDDTGKKVIIDVPPEEFNAFYDDFTRELADAEFEFRIMSWVITLLVSAIFGAIAFFETGRLLSPLKEFSKQAEHIEAENITEIKLEEKTIPEFQQLSKTINRMLLRLNDAFTTQKQFSSNAAHELRTPLALMQAKLDLYTEEHADEDPDSMETILLLSEQTDRLSHLVRTLLDMSEFEDIPRDDHVDFEPLTEEVLTDLLPLAEKQHIKLHQDVYNMILIGSDVLLYRLLFNLVENAIKYNHHGGSVFVSTSKEDDMAVLRVRDTGPGIPEEYQRSVFHPFFQTDKARSRSLGGVGLGLSLVWEIARLHGGTAKIESSSGEGTVFVVHLPIPASGQ